MEETTTTKSTIGLSAMFVVQAPFRSIGRYFTSSNATIALKQTVGIINSAS